MFLFSAIISKAKVSFKYNGWICTDTYDVNIPSSRASSPSDMSSSSEQMFKTFTSISVTETEQTILKISYKLNLNVCNTFIINSYGI
jgi:hypothetical protein